MKKKIKTMHVIIGAIVNVMTMLFRGVRSDPTTILGVNDDYVLKPLTIEKVSFFNGRLNLYLIRDYSLDKLSIKMLKGSTDILQHKQLLTMKDLISSTAIESLTTVDDMYYTLQTGAKCNYKYKRLVAICSTYITIDTIASNISEAPYVLNSSFRIYPSVTELKIVGIPCVILDTAVVDTIMIDTYVSDLLTYAIHAYDKKNDGV